MIPKKYIKTVLTAICLLFGNLAIVSSQNSNTLYYMDNLPQSGYLNPAKQTGCGFYFGLPALSSIYLNVDNNSLNFNDIIYRGTGEYSDSLITFLHPSQDVDDFLDKLKNKNIIATEFQANLLSFGLRVKSMYFSFGVYEKANFQASFPGDMAALLLKGNRDFLGKTADLSGFGASATWYREYSLGTSVKLLDNLTVGARGKLLFGKLNLSTNDVDMGIFTSQTGDLIRFHSSMTINTSIAESEIKRDSVGNFDGLEFKEDMDPVNLFLNTGNAGFALDLGAIMDITDKLTVTGSIIDFGFIKWKEGVFNLTQDGEFEFSGIDVSTGGTEEDATEKLLDEIDSTLTNITDRSETYTTGLGTKIYIGGTYKLNDNISFGILSRSGIYRKSFRQAITLSANAYVLNSISASLSYSMMNGSFANIGFGLGLRGGPFQFYLVSDNVSGMLLPHKTQSLNLRFGMNFMFGCRNKTNEDSLSAL